jgi:hypothetical protein
VNPRGNSRSVDGAYTEANSDGMPPAFHPWIEAWRSRSVAVSAEDLRRADEDGRFSRTPAGRSVMQDVYVDLRRANAACKLTTARVRPAMLIDMTRGWVASASRHCRWPPSRCSRDLNPVRVEG